MMSAPPPATPPRDEPPLLARARAASARAPGLVRAAAVDLTLDEGARLDDRLRAALEQRIATDIDALVLELRLHAARVLVSLGAGEAAATFSRSAPSTTPRSAGVLDDAALMAEWLGGARLALLEAGLRPDARGDRPGLLLRLAESVEPQLARAASALMTAKTLGQSGVTGELPGPIRERLVWRLTALLGWKATDSRVHLALTDAAETVIAGHDDSLREEVLALALADAIAPGLEELGVLLEDALRDRPLALLVALLARTSHFAFADARAILCDRDAARLTLLLHAQGLDRNAIARIGVALAAADAGRDLDQLADDLDALEHVTPEEAAGLFAPLVAHPAYREALLALVREA